MVYSFFGSYFLNLLQDIPTRAGTNHYLFVMTLFSNDPSETTPIVLMKISTISDPYEQEYNFPVTITIRVVVLLNLSCCY